MSGFDQTMSEATGTVRDTASNVWKASGVVSEVSGVAAKVAGEVEEKVSDWACALGDLLKGVSKKAKKDI